MRNFIDRKHLSLGLVLFLAAAGAIVLYFILYRYTGFVEGIERVKGILMPFVYGLVMAYLLCPLYNLCMRHFSNMKLLKKGRTDMSVFWSRLLSSVIALAALAAVVISLLWMIIPGMIDSIYGVIVMLPDKINEFAVWADKTADSLADTSGPMAGYVDTVLATLQKWAEETIIPGSEKVITGISASVVGVVSGLKNFFIGIIICVFFLNSKEKFAGQARKIVFATMNEVNAYKFLYGAHYANRTFGKFINGKLIDSLIIGVLCFLFMAAVKWPYAMLISVIVGVTNIIPFFGPFIGAIPSALLILMVDPVTCVYFLLFILALQQLDGNVIGPKILGGSTGIPSFWIMFAILVGGGLFGFTGMVLGIPCFACIYAYIAYKVDSRLVEKHLPTDMEIYRSMTDVFDKDYRRGVAEKENNR